MTGSMPERATKAMIAAGAELLRAFLDCSPQAAKRWAQQVYDAMARAHELDRAILLVEGAAPAAGHWDAEAVKDYLAEAADTLRRLPMDRSARPAQLRAGWPEVVHSYAEAGTNEAPELRISPPDPIAIARLDRVLEWMLWIPEDSRLIVSARAHGLSWPRIAERDGRSERTLRYRYEDAIDAILSRLRATTPRIYPFSGPVRGSGRRAPQTARYAG